MKRKSAKTLRAECTHLWGLVVRNRDNHTCQWCGKPGNQPHHIVSKAQGNIARFDVDNGITLCFYCHMRRIQREPLEFAEFVHRWLAARKLDYDGMRKKYQQIQKLGGADYNILKNSLRNALLRRQTPGPFGPGLGKSSVSPHPSYTKGIVL